MARPALVQKTYNYSCGGGTWNNFGITEYYVTQLAAAIYCTECDDGTSYACINGQSHGGAVGAYSLTLHSWTYSAPGSGSGAGTLLGTSSACLRIGGFFPPCTGDPETGNDLFCGQFTGTFPCNASADYLRSGVERQVNCSVEGIQTILEDPTAAISLSC